MGKKYYCEYCDKRFKDDVNIRQKHISGLAHQRARKDHYAKYKEPKAILEEEAQKKKCSWFQSGYCQFGAACRSSHYTQEQLDELRQRVAQDEYDEWLKLQPKKYSVDVIENFMADRRQRRQHQIQTKLRLFFEYPEHFARKQQELPPSLRLIQSFEIASTENCNVWGSNMPHQFY